MSNSNRGVVEQSLRSNWVTELSRRGFDGTPWRFQRKRQDYVDIVSVEWKVDSCRVIIGIEPRNFPSGFREQIPNFDQLGAAECQFQEVIGPAGGYWFNYSAITADDALVLSEVVTDRFDQVADRFFNQFDSLDWLLRITPDDVRDNPDVSRRFNGMLRVAAVFLCNMYVYLGEIERAKTFAEVGLQIKKGTFGQAKMNKVLTL
jgi:hypothetical protein